MLIIDGLDLENNGFIFVLNGLFNNEKQLFESDLFSDGSFIGNEKIKAKKLSLNGTITNNLVSNMDKLNQILYRKGAKKIEFSMGNKEYMMMANVENTSLSDKRSIVINLISPDPYKYSRYPEVLNINETKGVGVKFPLQFPVKFEGGESFERYITNIGNVTSYPVITIVGPCRDFSIKNITTDEKLDFAGLELLDGDALVIDNRPKSRGIYLNGANRIDLKLGNWISCNIGQNYFTFSRVSNSSNNLCTIEFQSRWT